MASGPRRSSSPVPTGGAPNKDGSAPTEDVTLDVPLLALVKVPSLAIKTVDVTFDMEVKSAETSKESDDKSVSGSLEVSGGWGPVKGKLSVSGSVASHKENTRSTDQSAKYHVAVHASDDGMPEGLARVLDIMNSAIAPKSIAASSASSANDAGSTGSANDASSAGTGAAAASTP
ncbi:DUF2589 domain-containing protein [Cystobacter fuscus]